MRRILLPLTAVLVVCLAVPFDLDARGRRGGRGGGRKTATSVSRSPSMSRATRTRPSRAPTQRRPQTQRQRRPQPRHQSTARRASGSRAMTRDQMRQFVQNHPTKRPTMRPSQRPGVRPGVAPGTPSRQRPSVQRPRNQRDLQNVGSRVRRDIRRDRVDRNTWFTANFWNQHNYRPGYWRPSQNWWVAPTAVGLASWLGWRHNPYYYGYYPMDGEYYWGPWQDSSSMVEISTAFEGDGTQQMQANQPPSSSPQQEGGWMPLGIFALASETSEVTPNRYLQLALSRNGVVSGTYYNETTDETFPVAGQTDPQSQRIVWSIGSPSGSASFETGLYNLTQPEAEVRVHFSNGTTQDAVLVRMDDG